MGRLQLARLFVQPFFQPAEPFRAEQGFQDFAAFVRLEHQEPEELALGQDHELAELVRLEAQECLHDLRRGSRRAGQHLFPSAVLHFDQAACRLDRRRALAAFLRRFLFRRTGHAVRAPPALKGQGDFGPARGIRIVAAQALSLAQIAARLAVQGEGDGIEDRRFAASRRPGDQKELVSAQSREINGFRACIRPEGRHL